MTGAYLAGVIIDGMRGSDGLSAGRWRIARLVRTAVMFGIQEEREHDRVVWIFVASD